jgi:hypothetical protein
VIAAVVAQERGEMLAVVGVSQTLEMFDGPVEPSHEKETDGQTVADDQGAGRVVGLGKVARQRVSRKPEMRSKTSAPLSPSGINAGLIRLNLRSFA